MTPPTSPGPERLYCLAYCQHRKHRPNGEACRTACPLDLPYLVHQAGGDIELHMEGEIHLLDPGTLPQLLDLKFVVSLFQEGAEFLEPGHITPVREQVPTGTAHPDRDGAWVLFHLHDKTYRTWATAPGWLRDLAEGKLVLAPVRELLEEVLQ